ncbi:hypothetical protein DPMN_054060 [Dreissena polymorpha]|uniref:Uncharacterized protein n=1 Tax=Dreissena polymorpha TaxID=45954 RepID=A0A9D4HSR8_DREPO|nr:hypothetical protein DPMN_054060 [Dreissena polymorpha]
MCEELSDDIDMDDNDGLLDQPLVLAKSCPMLWGKANAFDPCYEKSTQKLSPAQGTSLQFGDHKTSLQQIYVEYSNLHSRTMDWTLDPFTDWDSKLLKRQCVIDCQDIISFVFT